MKNTKTYSLPEEMHQTIDLLSQQKHRGNKSATLEYFVRLGMQADAQGMKLETGDEHGQQSE